MGSRRLKDCPFCGGEAYFRVTSNGICAETRKIGFQIECKVCRVSIPKTYEIELTIDENGDIKTLKDERGIAAGKWNKRTT